MKNIYFNRLRKNKDKDNNIQKTSVPLNQYINNGNRLNSFSGLNKIGVNRSDHLNCINRSNNLVKSYNQSIIYMQNYQNKHENRCNNHSLYDSNKQQIINIDNNNDYIRFESEKFSKKVHLSNNNSIYNSSNNKNSIKNNNNNDNNVRNYTYQKNNYNNNITNINCNINIQNFTNKKIITNNSNNNFSYNKNKTYKYINLIKYDLMKNRNNFSNYKNNYNFTEINESSKGKNLNVIKNKKKEQIKRNLTENNYLKNKEMYKGSRSTSIMKLELYKLKKDKKNNNNINKVNVKISEFKDLKYKINLPIKLNIENTNKEKLSRLKRIIEQGSSNMNYYKMEISKNLLENRNKNQNQKQIIFKKKKISLIKKEESKEGDFDSKKETNFLTKSTTIKNLNKRPNLILSTQIYNTNYKLQSRINPYNLNVHKENNKKNEINKERNQRMKYNETSNINDDTISLSYSKEQNISFISKKMNINDKNISLPFLIEKFNIHYNKYNKDLIIYDINKKNIENNNESEDDDFQLTKEIILLKRGLAKKSELSNELRKKIREMRIQRIHTLSLFGNKKIYIKKMSNYKITKF